MTYHVFRVFVADQTDRIVRSGDERMVQEYSVQNDLLITRADSSTRFYQQRIGTLTWRDLLRHAQMDCVIRGAGEESLDLLLNTCQ